MGHAVEEGVKKARRAFFMHSSQLFKGKAIFEIYVLPVLFYGCENWPVALILLLTQVGSAYGTYVRSRTARHCSYAGSP